MKLIVGIYLLLTCVDSRKSDYKRIIFSDFVRGELRNNFAKQYAYLASNNDTFADHFRKLWQRHEDAKLIRLQPEQTVFENRTIPLTNNRKDLVTLTTMSKRRPLIFQIDDFLFDDECEHIKTLALKHGMEKSETAGDDMERQGISPGLYDDIGAIEFEDFDLDEDKVINITELLRGFRTIFDNRMGSMIAKNIAKDTYMDFNLDGVIEKWEWNIKNLTLLVKMLNESRAFNPASQARFSEQVWLSQTDSNDSVLLSLQDRLHQVTGLPLEMIRNSEQLQVVRYKPGGHYDCHLDSDPRYYEDNFRPCCHVHNASSEEDQDCSSCRYMTVLFYLDDTERGGETAFPVAGVDPYKYNLANENGGSEEEWCDLTMHCSQASIRVKPKKGRAVLWYNHFIDPDTEWMGAVDRNSLHGGCAVHRGSKWIANNWINAGHHKEHDVLSWIINEWRTEKEDEEGEIEEDVDESIVS